MFNADLMLLECVRIETLKKIVESKGTLTVKFQKGAFDGLTATDMSEGATTLVNSGGAASPMKEKEPKSQHLLFRAGLCLFLSVFYI